jgi:hypothetical protein
LWDSSAGAGTTHYTPLCLFLLSDVRRCGETTAKVRGNISSTFFLKSQSQYSLFSLVIFTYTYERQYIIQIALKRLPGRGGAPKKV